MDKSGWHLLIKSAEGTIRSRVDDFLSLHVVREVNQPGRIEFSLPGGHPAIACLEDRSIVEVWRKDQRIGLGWTCEARGLYLSKEIETRETTVFRAACPGALWLLAGRIVAYPPQVTGLSLFSGPASTTARTLVLYNAAQEATLANGRLRPGGVNGIQVEDGADEGPELDWECSCANLLKTLQELASAVDSDFDLEYQPPASWWFRWYAGISGGDRTREVHVRLENGVMSEPLYRLDKRSSANAAIVGGVDANDSPIYAVSEGLWEASEGDIYPEGRTVEVYDYAQNCRTEPELLGRADMLLASKAPRHELSFEVRQSPACAYGVHYHLGDLLTALYQGMSFTVQVRRVEVELETGSMEKIRVVCRKR